MKTLSITMPEEILEIYSNIEELKTRIVEDFVAGEYEKGNISIRQGAMLLGITYEEFMVDFLGKRKISFISGTEDELESEFREEASFLDAIMESSR